MRASTLCCFHSVRTQTQFSQPAIGEGHALPTVQTSHKRGTCTAHCADQSEERDIHCPRRNQSEERAMHCPLYRPISREGTGLPLRRPIRREGPALPLCRPIRREGSALSLCRPARRQGPALSTVLTNRGERPAYDRPVWRHGFLTARWLGCFRDFGPRFVSRGPDEARTSRPLIAFCR